MNLSLGCASLGQSYGIANSTDILPSSELKKILERASELRICHLDTSISYGESQKIIGKFWPSTHQARVTTKIPSTLFRDKRLLVKTIRQSLLETKQNEFWAILIHDPDAFASSNITHIKSGFRLLIDEGLTSRIGLSAYSEKEVVRAKDNFSELSVFQIPENICDQRKYNSESLLSMMNQGDSLFVRSIFLQGLLLMDERSIPDKVSSARGTLISLRNYARNHSMSLLEVSICYAKSIPWASHLVVGINSELQLNTFADVFERSGIQTFEDAPRLSDQILDPRNWS